MTVSDVASILVRAGEVEMPCVYYLTEIRHSNGLPSQAADAFWRCTSIPPGKKLVVYKVGVTSFDSAHEATDAALITTGGGGWYEYTGPYNEVNLEFSDTYVIFYAYNKGNEPSKFGVWFLFDFEPE